MVVEYVGNIPYSDVLIYDLFVQSIPESDAKPPILLVEAPEAAAHEDSQYWLRFIDEMKELDAEQIVFLFMPSNAGPAFYKRAVADGNVVFGRPWSPGGVGSKPYLAPLPKGVGDLPVIYGLVVIPPSFYGVHRRYSAYQNVMGSDVPTIVNVAVKDRYGSGQALMRTFGFILTV